MAFAFVFGNIRATFAPGHVSLLKLFDGDQLFICAFALALSETYPFLHRQMDQSDWGVNERLFYLQGRY